MEKKHYFVTGGAGFIGSNLVDNLIADGHEVTVYDNFSTGKLNFLEQAKKSGRLNVIEADLLDFECLTRSLKGMDCVYHLAANADVRFGTSHPVKDLEQNTLATSNVLEAMRLSGVSKILFSSTGSVYGEPTVFPTPEIAPFPIQTSLYGASKLACEGLISAYCTGFGFCGTVLRFVSVLGDRYTHGHVYDFCKKLLQDSSSLQILGDGKQQKSYMHVSDCINGMRTSEHAAKEGFNVYNLGHEGYINVDASAAIIADTMNVQPSISYTGGSRGWVGDSPFIFLDTRKISALGWSPEHTIEDSVRMTASWLLANKWCFS